MNYLANFNQTWWETCFRDGDSDLFIRKGWPLLELNKGQNKEKFDIKKSFKFVKMNSLGSQMAKP